MESSEPVGLTDVSLGEANNALQSGDTCGGAATFSETSLVDAALCGSLLEKIDVVQGVMVHSEEKTARVVVMMSVVGLLETARIKNLAASTLSGSDNCNAGTLMHKSPRAGDVIHTKAQSEYGDTRIVDSLSNDCVQVDDRMNNSFEENVGHRASDDSFYCLRQSCGFHRMKLLRPKS